MALKEYRKKRNLKRSNEPLPSARTNKVRSKQLIFVVQKHYATHLHYDFRLEMRGILKSWAVPKGPPRSPSDKRLAIQVEDHPYEYAKFHGVIPKGEYGAGKVLIWDSGTYSPLSGSIRSGEMVFELRGRKLKGAYALVKMKSQRNWLLIKKKRS